MASVSISRMMRCWVAGRPKCFPRISAAIIPAITRSLMSEDSSSTLCGAPHNAEFERDRIGERIRQTKRAQKGRREYLGGGVPFGFVKSTDGRSLIEDPVQQAAIRRIRELRSEGLSAQRISAALKADGVRLSHVSVLKIAARAA